MYLKCHRRNKTGKLHRYWSNVERSLHANGHSAKRQVHYLGEIIDSDKANFKANLDAKTSGGRLECDLPMIVLGEFSKKAIEGP